MVEMLLLSKARKRSNQTLPWKLLEENRTRDELPAGVLCLKRLPNDG
jgi:hypothetical protein